MKHLLDILIFAVVPVLRPSWVTFALRTETNSRTPLVPFARNHVAQIICRTVYAHYIT